MKNLKKLISKICTKEVMFYIFFGVLTTLINLGSFYIMTKIFTWNENLSNFLAIALAVLFAYVTNKDLVFHSKANGLKEKLNEFIKFIAGRAFKMVIEFIGGAILFETAIPEMISKLFVTVVVVIMNFFISKFFTFKTKKVVNKQEGEKVEK